MDSPWEDGGGDAFIVEKLKALKTPRILVINKMDSAKPEDIETVKANCKRLAPNAVIIEADSELTVDGDIKGKRVLVVEDGPTLTHGGMKIGAASVAAKRFGVKEMVDPRPAAVGKIAFTYKKYPNIGEGILPAMGYGEEQTRDLEKTINTQHTTGIL